MKCRSVALILALIPALAWAADEDSPRSRCFDKAARMERSLFQQMARAGEAGARSQRVEVTQQSRGIMTDGQYGLVESRATIRVPALNQLLLRELTLLEQRKAECARLPQSDQDSTRTVVGRGNGTRRLKLLKEDGS